MGGPQGSQEAAAGRTDLGLRGSDFADGSACLGGGSGDRAGGLGERRLSSGGKSGGGFLAGTGPTGKKGKDLGVRLGIRLCGRARIAGFGVMDPERAGRIRAEGVSGRGGVHVAGGFAHDPFFEGAGQAGSGWSY